MSIDELRSRRDEILSLADRHGARNVRVFGSVARGDDRPESDVDLLIDVERGRSLLDVSPYLQQRILNEAAFLQAFFVCTSQRRAAEPPGSQGKIRVFLGVPATRR